MIVLVKRWLITQVRKHVHVSGSLRMIVSQINDFSIVIDSKNVRDQSYQVPNVFLTDGLIFQINLSYFLHDFRKSTLLGQVQDAPHNGINVVVVKFKVLIVVKHSYGDQPKNIVKTMNFMKIW